MSPARMARFESAIRLVIAFNEAFNRHDVAAMLQHLSDDCLFEATGPAPNGAVYRGKAAITQFWQAFFRASPHAHSEIEEIFGFSVRCMLRWRYDWVDLAGTKGYVRGVTLFQVRNGLICETLAYVKGDGAGV